MRAFMTAMVAGVALIAVVAAPALACGPATDGRVQIPPPAAALDELLPEAKLSPEQIEKAKALRVRITTAMTAGDEKTAREAEEEAMEILGYRKAWLRCGPGTFAWMKVPERAKGL